MLKPVYLYLRPIFELIGGDILDKYRLVVTRIGIRTLCADGLHQLVILIGDEQLGGFVTDRVYGFIHGAALLLVGELAVLLEQSLYLVQHRFLGGVIYGAVILRTLEHQVLEIVGQPRGAGRIVFRPRLNGYLRLNTRGLFVHRCVDLQSVVERIDAHSDRVAFDSLV